MKAELKIAVCDDEKFYQNHIKDLIEEYMKERALSFCVDIFQNGLDFCSNEKNINQYDIIFLDIKMEEMDGMKAARMIREKNKKVDIVFITVMMEYVFEGYQVGAFRYIMKSDLEVLLPECLHAICNKKVNGDLVMQFSFVGGRTKVPVNEIVYIESEAHKVWFKGIKEELHIYGQIDEIEKELMAYGFIRTHQSFMVNLEHIERIKNYRLYLSNGKEIPATKDRYPKIKERFFRHKEII